ncbi:hypothetical protein HMPREF9946_00917 [Acetobacteraceae bacterium AT-5844]|nr:hypothetical protein HMPREF9946_00917 [Acetobacteraceae bacterium AT-5844]
MPGTDQCATQYPTLVQGAAHMGTSRTHRLHAPFMSDQNNADILPGVLVPDFHPPGAVFFQF